MESFFDRYKNALVLIAVLLAQTLLLAVQVRDLRGPSQADGRKVLLLRSWAVAIVTPFERVTTFSGKGIRGAWSDYIDLRHTRQQNAALQSEVARLRLEQAEFAEDALQGRRLQALLQFREQYVTSTVAAQVIGTSGVEQSRVLLIDKGKDYGLKPDMAVITPDGIVGKLRDVFAHTAQVLEIDDPSSGAGVILASTRIRAIVRGAPDGRIQIGNLGADSRIKPGEVVLTSGGDQVFPRGLKVGTVESISQDRDRQIYTLIQVRPAANLSQLEEVLVITGTQPELPAQAQQDLASGEATSLDLKADARRAADLAAERLPSLTPAPNADGSVPGADASANDPNKPGGAVPKPIPALHPDRYTPGVTPSAADLKPGGNNPNPSTSPAASDAGAADRDENQDNAAAPDAVPRKSKAATPAKQASPEVKEPQL
jgi:rod shape-determining protein MreC